MIQNQSKWRSKALKSDDGKWSIRKNGFSYHGWLLWIKKIERKNLSNDENWKWRLLIASSLNVVPMTN